MSLAREMFRDKVKGNFDDILDNLRASSKCLVGSHRANSSTHLEHEGTIFIVVMIIATKILSKMTMQSSSIY